MKRKALLPAVMVCTLTLTGCPAEADNGVQTVTCLAEETEITHAEAVYSTEEIFGSFNGAFLKEYLKEQDSFVISPLSAKLALSMAAAGADSGSVTEKELLDLFGYGTKEDMLGDCGRIVSDIGDSETISTANSTWLSERLDGLNDSCSDVLNDVFAAERFTEDLSSNGFVKKFNKWVDKNTNGMIPELLKEPLSEDARLALVNTLYFKNEWVLKFDAYSTHDQDFHGKSGTVQAPIMHLTEDLQYAEGELFKSVVLPYTDGSYMQVYLPLDEDAQIADLIAEMSVDELNSELESEHEIKNIALALPKFECESGGSLVEMLERLGVREAFDPNSASFGGITDDEDERLYISAIIQAAKIICDEEGTEAAAATLVAMDEGVAMPAEDIIEFTVDRPFLYEIKTASGETLFMGVMQDIRS